MKKNRMTKMWISLLMLLPLGAQAADQFVTFDPAGACMPLSTEGKAVEIAVSTEDHKGVLIAAENLTEDFLRVTGQKATINGEATAQTKIIIGSIDKSPLVKQLVKGKKIDGKSLDGKREMYLITTIDNAEGGKTMVIAGSDKRGTIYGIYELSEQMGVSPWFWWADVPVEKHTALYVKPGTYTDGEPAVYYRGIFLNDEAPCLTTWVKNTYGTNYGDHNFYAQVFELILRLKGNFLWPAMWSWAFYADDPLNGKTADEMGVIIGTSHHEPMARNHQEWARKRSQYGKWDYTTNKETLDQFFREGIERMKDTEDLVTIGMRGDGDAAMSDDVNVKLLEENVENQRKIIKDVTGRPAKETPQVWALYKEVLQYYEAGMRVPDDVIMLLTDDNWGNVCRLPNEKERKHPGGWGLYYHVDYVGAPRNSKWINYTPIQNMWEQLQLTYDYGVDKLWVLNVGDLKPMEYPITLFLDMAWNPKQYTASNLLDHPKKFCAATFGEDQAEEAARILNLYCKYAGRVTAEMLDRKTYNLETGEWKKVSDEFIKLEAEALRQYITLAPEYHDAYKQLILFPVQAMANLYEMYYAQAMNHKLYAENNPEANEWADVVERTFQRDKELCDDYNHNIAGGKWNGMMIQKHIGYTSWNDNFRENILPKTNRIDTATQTAGGYVFTGENGYVAMEAEHFFEQTGAAGAAWTKIPYVGRTLSGMALMPYTAATDGASLSYRMQIPADVKEVTVHVIVKSTLAFHNPEGHRYGIGFKGGEETVINFNGNLNEKPENVYSVYYPTVARRVIEKKVDLTLPAAENGMQTLVFRPIEPGTVLEKIVVDYGGYKPSYLFMKESPCKKQ